MTVPFLVLGVLGLSVVLVQAEPRAAPVYMLSEISTGFGIPSGIAEDGPNLLLTDLRTGRVVRRAPDGGLQDLMPPRPTGIDVLGQPTGPYKVAIHAGRVYVTQGWPDSSRDARPGDHAFLEASPDATISPLVKADGFWNPYDFTWSERGWLIVDSGKNALMRLAPDGALATVLEFPRIKHAAEQMQSLSPTEFSGKAQPYEVDAVPTGIAVHGDRVYIALLGGFPFVAKGGAVVSLALNGTEKTARPEVTGLDAPVALAFAPDSRLLILELGQFDFPSGHFVTGGGRLLAVDAKGKGRETLASGLDQPSGLLARANGEILITCLSGHVYRLVKR
ncbi:MAG TPA: ScyD/ScyE family protein [Dongiaceae bacterium]|nr:ScyD/ScyE family protein [Dongiaceae bacterium]